MTESENFCAADLWDESKSEYRRAIVKITKVSGGTVVGQKGRKKKMPFVWLEYENGTAARAPLGLNATNATTVSQVLGTPDAKKWPGGWIGLYVTKVDGPDGITDGIRIHPKQVQPRTGKPADQKSQSPKSDITRGEVEQQLKADGLIDETSKERVDKVERESRETLAEAKARIEGVIGRSVDENPDLTEAEMRAIELAEAEEARNAR